jgi:hypothetical protein
LENSGGSGEPTGYTPTNFWKQMFKRAGRCNGNNSDLYSGSESKLEHRRFWDSSWLPSLFPREIWDSISTSPWPLKSKSFPNHRLSSFFLRAPCGLDSENLANETHIVRHKRKTLYQGISFH